ncbi:MULTISPECIES: TetR/AcrR family transcriptional regulator [unclassified Variovorax]|uniref:TetR/AcrR family transcriptional regulator n=1 Tax=unclassified Variovorax TaxID=663243 RepID=UPI0032E59ADD
MAGVRQFDEAKVLDAVLDVFWQKGWRATSMADLAEAADVQRGSLYHAYGGKEELFLLAFEAYATRFLDNARAALDKPRAETALRAFFKVAIANMTQGVPPRGCLTTKTATEVDGAGPRIQERLRQLLDELQGVVSAAMSKGDMSTQLSLSPKETAQVVITFTRGLAVMERVYQNAPSLHRMADAVIKALVPNVKRRTS